MVNKEHFKKLTNDFSPHFHDTLNKGMVFRVNQSSLMN